MSRRQAVALCGATIIAMAGGLCGWAAAAKTAGGQDEARRGEIDAFNRKMIDAHLKMDNEAVMDLWAEDGVSLLPGTAPMIGKKAITKFLDDVTARMPGNRMEKLDMDFQGIEVSGEWASEWALEHQIVKAPDGQIAFDGHGKMLLVLHRGTDSKWRIKREMWNQGMKDETK